MKIRIKFSKWGCMKFIGHLDMMRYFQKAIRRANIDICYSEGFSPHQIMSFAAPLGVGITSEGEYFDIEVNETLSSQDAIAALNAVMVDGVKVEGYVKLDDHAKTAMSIVEAADYTMTLKEGYENPYTKEEWKQILQEKILDQKEFLITKKTKKSEREVDLKPLVYEFKVIEEKENLSFFFKLSSGSTDNIKPELVLASLYEKCGQNFENMAYAIHRVEVYAKKEDSEELIPLLAMGEEIG